MLCDQGRRPRVIRESRDAARPHRVTYAERRGDEVDNIAGCGTQCSMIIRARCAWSD
jgi:hypothetical protein